MKAKLSKMYKKSRRLYIFPTKMGGYLIGLIFLMFLLSIGYNNNLLLIFTLSLFSLNLMWLIQGHHYLSQLKMDSLQLKQGHAEELNPVKVFWKKIPEGPHHWNFTLENDQGECIKVINQKSHDSSTSCGNALYPQRGLWSFDYLKVSTSKPFGLYVVWKYIPCSVKVHVYPKKSPNEKLPPLHQSGVEGETLSSNKGLHDVWNLASYQGEESRRISWKHYARTGDLLIKEGEELKKNIVYFKILSQPNDKVEFERELSKITSQILLCEQNDIIYGLELPCKKILASHGAKHLENCLKELSLC